MKKILLPLSLGAILFTGCANIAQPNKTVKFYTASKVDVIKKGSKIYISDINNNAYDSKPLLKELKQYFIKDGVFKIVDNIKDADVLITFDTYYSYRADDSTQTNYNKRYYKYREVYRDGKGRETGGKDYLRSENHSASTATLIVSVAIYDKKHLEPLAYFDIDPTDTSKVILNKSSSMYKSNDYFRELFTKQVVEKLNDLVTTKYKDTKVFFPKNADKKLVSLLQSNQYSKAISYAKSILPSFDLSEVSVEKYKELADASKKDPKIKKRDLEKDLANFYVYYLAKEATDISPQNIKEVHKAYKKIISLTNDDSLIVACANSLGRVEFQADRLKIFLGDN